MVGFHRRYSPFTKRILELIKNRTSPLIITIRVNAGTLPKDHWIKAELDDLPGLDIRVWRSVSTAFMRAFIHRKLFGQFWLRIIYLLEEMMPRILGRYGQYPLFLFVKPDQEGLGRGIRNELER